MSHSAACSLTYKLRALQHHNRPQNATVLGVADPHQVQYSTWWFHHCGYLILQPAVALTAREMAFFLIMAVLQFEEDVLF
jgi:hypothetical protein